MSYSHIICESLVDFDDNFYRAIQIKISSSFNKFEEKGLPLYLRVTNGIDVVDAFKITTSGTQKALTGYFTVDAFAAFSTPATIEFGYIDQPLFQISDVNVVLVPSLPIDLALTPHLTADNIWLGSL